MNVRTARQAAIRWVTEHASKEEWFQGAYFSGSIIEMQEETELAEHSDVDIVVVMKLDEPPMKLGKFLYDGALLEVTYLSMNQLKSAKEVLISYHLAGSFRMDTIIADPTGHLSELQSEVSLHFAEKEWVLRRCGNVMQKIQSGLNSIDVNAPFYDLVTSWLFPTGITTHLILVAALRNPTVRKRYLAVREVLFKYGYEDIYNKLIDLLGCTELSPQRMEQHLEHLAQTFDVAAAVAKTPFMFSTDITASARPIAIDGSRELIRAGNHREAVFWIVATFSRCHKILAVDASPETLKAHLPAFEEMVADLGLRTSNDFICRAKDVSDFLPRLWEAAEDIVTRNN